MPFKDYEQVHEPLVLPIRGVQYTIPPVTAEDGITLNRALDSGDISRISDADFERMLLGDTATRMRADHVTKDAIRTATLTAFADFRSGRDAAQVVWEADGHPKAPTPATKAPSTRRRASGTTRTNPKD